MPDYYPVCLDLRGRPCLVVGAGAVATRKAEGLLECGARVTVVAPEATPEVRLWAEQQRLRWEPRPYRTSDFDGAVLAVASTSDPSVNRQVYLDAERLGRPVNVVDVPELCTFILPSVFHRGPVSVAVSTSGRSPTLARSLRQRLEAEVGPEYGRLAELLGELRPRVQGLSRTGEENRVAWERAVASEALDLIREGRVEAARETLEQCLLS